jgi:hypothetical protein
LERGLAQFEAGKGARDGHVDSGEGLDHGHCGVSGVMC